MSKLARSLALVAMLAAMAVTGMTAVAQAHVADQAVRRPPNEEKVGEYWRGRPVSAQDRSDRNALRLLLARERFSYPSDVPAQATSPVRPAEPSGRAGWLAPALTGLALVVVLIAGVTVIATRRANRVQRAGQTA
jgi:hypothetical protein